MVACKAQVLGFGLFATVITLLMDPHDHEDVAGPQPTAVYFATVDRVVDGDTVDLHVHLGFDLCLDGRFRVTFPDGSGFDAPEVRGEERPEGLRATKVTRKFFPAGSACRVRVFGDENDERGKYGRWLGALYPGARGERDLASILLGYELGEREEY